MREIQAIEMMDGNLFQVGVDQVKSIIYANKGYDYDGIVFVVSQVDLEWGVLSNDAEIGIQHVKRVRLKDSARWITPQHAIDLIEQE